MSELKIGDEVSWKGAWGSQASKRAVVTEIEVTNGGKYGDEVNSVEWTKVRDRNVVVTLDNGHWAYGEQISRIGSFR
jgi:hypothetical protein